jgi:UDP-N-acetylmuramyl pentapeptide phosphotransferase/UDP-N-acetylglucosamine-1-phosphate transferase
VTVALAALAGFVAGRLAWLALRPVLAQPLFARENYRGHPVATAGGLVTVVALLVVEAVRSAASVAGLGEDGGLTASRVLVLLAAGGFALLGLVDDLGGTAHARGFRGHLAALGRGEVTTGLVKLAGGSLLAVVLVSPLADESLLRLLADAGLVALAANLGNLLDRAPGRAGKAALVAFAVLAVGTTAASVLAAPAVLVGAVAGVLPEDLRERLMLGDTGANATGAVLGLAVVMACSPAVRTGTLAAVLALNLASEVVSFSRVIETVAPLRALDRLGRRP